MVIFLTHFVCTNIKYTIRINVVLAGGMDMDYISVRNTSERWKVSDRWTQKLCEKGRLEGVKRFGRSWVIPKDAGKPKC